jgi:hypothetical protein
MASVAPDEMANCRKPRQAGQIRNGVGCVTAMSGGVRRESAARDSRDRPPAAAKHQPLAVQEVLGVHGSVDVVDPLVVQ